jgi:hypothetical protein
MGLAFKNPAAVNANSLKNTVSIEQTVIVDADLGVLFIVKFSVNPDFKRHRETTPPG